MITLDMTQEIIHAQIICKIFGKLSSLFVHSAKMIISSLYKPMALKVAFARRNKMGHYPQIFLLKFGRFVRLHHNLNIV